MPSPSYMSLEGLDSSKERAKFSCNRVQDLSSQYQPLTTFSLPDSFSVFLGLARRRFTRVQPNGRELVGGLVFVILVGCKFWKLGSPGERVMR